MQIPYHQGEPKIFLELQAKNGVWIGFIAYVDSGASYSVFQPDIAKTLAIDLKAGKKTKLTVGNGDKIVVYLHKINVKILDFAFTATIGFSPDLGIDTNLIGQKDFFEKFKICFNSKDKFLEITKL